MSKRPRTMPLPWPSLGRRAGAMAWGYASYDDGSAPSSTCEKSRKTKRKGEKQHKHEKQRNTLAASRPRNRPQRSLSRCRGTPHKRQTPLFRRNFRTPPWSPTPGARRWVDLQASSSPGAGTTAGCSRGKQWRAQLAEPRLQSRAKVQTQAGASVYGGPRHPECAAELPGRQ